MSRSEEQRPESTARFAVRSIVGLGGVLAAGIVFAVVLALVASGSPLLRDVDRGAVDAANAVVGDRPWMASVLRFLTTLGGAEVSWVVIPVVAVWLLVRRSPRLATYVAVTGLGAAVLDPGVKALVGRLRPVVDVAVASAPGPSFPSGHALGSTVTFGVLLLVFLPAVPSRFRRAAVFTAVTVVGVVGITRIALGVHYPSDVVGGWLLGVLWLGVTASAFRSWREQEGLGRPPVSRGLAPEQRPVLVPAPAHDEPLPDGWRSASQLLVAAVLLCAALVGVGALITDVLPSVRQFDAAVVGWFATIRTEALTTVAVLSGHLGSTAGIVLVLLVAVGLSLGLTRRWRPPLFLLLAVAGETAVFLVTATLVERARPDVDYLSPTLPPTSSFPSGHVAAAVATYGAIALLSRAWTRGWLPRLLTAWAVIAPLAVALSRLYRGVHHPTDTIASAVYAVVWLVVCWRVLQPVPQGMRSGSEVAGAGDGDVEVDAGDREPRRRSA